MFCSVSITDTRYINPFPHIIPLMAYTNPWTTFLPSAHDLCAVVDVAQCIQLMHIWCTQAFAEDWDGIQLDKGEGSRKGWLRNSALAAVKEEAMGMNLWVQTLHEGTAQDSCAVWTYDSPASLGTEVQRTAQWWESRCLSISHSFCS